MSICKSIQNHIRDCNDFKLFQNSELINDYRHFVLLFCLFWNTGLFLHFTATTTSAAINFVLTKILMWMLAFWQFFKNHAFRDYIFLTFC